VLDDKYPEYRAFMQKRAKQGDFVILDNSLIELGYAMEVDQLVQAAMQCGASEIVLPDTFMNPGETISLIREAVKELKDKYLPHGWKAQLPFRLMAVAQGTDLQSWLACLDEILTIDNCISTIGIPKNTNNFFPDTDKGRIQLLQALSHKEYYLRFPWIQWHMLGSWDNPIEVQFASKFRWIRGCDTSIAWACAQVGLSFDNIEGLHIPRPKQATIDFMDTVDRYPMITAYNIITMLGWSKYHE
jgi:hypothetical protein